MQIDTGNLKLVPAKCGCEGCYFEDADECPSKLIQEGKGYHLETFNCSESDEPMIYTLKEDGDE